MKLQLLYVLLVPICFFGQVEKTTELHLQLAQMDALLFETGFNRCDLQKMETLLAADFEFYHDVGGVQDKIAFLKATKENICENSTGKVTRQLIEGSLQTFPLKKNNVLYGALLSGEHEFYMQKPNEENKKTGYAKFTGYWELQDGDWKLKRVFSFDHKAAK